MKNQLALLMLIGAFVASPALAQKYKSEIPDSRQEQEHDLSPV